MMEDGGATRRQEMATGMDESIAATAHPMQVGMDDSVAAPGHPLHSHNLLDLVGMNGMDMVLQQMLCNLPAIQAAISNTNSTWTGEGEQGLQTTSSVCEEGKGEGSSASESYSTPHSPPPLLCSANENVGPVDHHMADNPLKRERARTPPLSSLPLSSILPPTRDSYMECYSSCNRDEVDALIYSLFVTAKGPPREGFENYECLSRTKHKCRYKVRVRLVSGEFVVEERGCHSHPFDPSAFNSQGLPRSLREIVDVSFNEGWTNQARQDAVDAEVARLGLPPNPKMNRQIDNRLSYLRRTKNIQASNQALVSGGPMEVDEGVGMMGQKIPVGPEWMPPTEDGTLEQLLSGLGGSVDVALLAQLMKQQQDALARLPH